MKHLTKINIVGSVMLFLVVWVPITRLFMRGYAIDYAIFVLSIIIAISSILALRNKQSRIHILTLIFSLSPFIFFVYWLISLLFFNAPFAP